MNEFAKARLVVQYAAAVRRLHEYAKEKNDIVATEITSGMVAAADAQEREVLGKL